MVSSGIIFDIKKFAIHDGPGIRTTVFLKGCPLNCWWCHNPEGRNENQEKFCLRYKSKPGRGAVEKEKLIGRFVRADEVMAEVARDVIFYDQSGGGVTFSGGEPLMQPEFLETLLTMCRQEGIHTAVDTSGYAPAEVFDKIYDLVDLFLYDIKNINDEMHMKYTGVSNHRILENLIRLSERGNKTWLRLPIIPGITDTQENLEEILEFISPLKKIKDIGLLPYNRLAEDKLNRFNLPNRLGKLPAVTESHSETIARLFRQQGYQVKIGG